LNSLDLTRYRTFGVGTIAALLITLFLAGCGGGGSDDASGNDGQGESGGASDSGGQSGGPGILPTLPATIGNIPGVSNECEAVINVYLGIAQLFTGTGGDAQQIIEATQGDFPDQIKDDIQTLANVVGEYSNLIGDLQIDLVNNPLGFAALTPEQQARFQAASAAFSAPEVEQAFENISNYGEKECTGFVRP